MRPNDMRASRVLAALGVAAASVVMTPGPSYACSCVAAGTAEHLARADVVVRGVVESREEPPPAEVRSSADPVTYTVAVAEVYKGSAGAVLEVRSALDGASCGLEHIRVGREYVVFAAQAEDGPLKGQLWASLCGGTAPATPDLVAGVEAVTGTTGPIAGGAPAPTPPDDVPAGQQPAPEGAPVYPWVLGGVAAAAAAGVLLWRRAR